MPKIFIMRGLPGSGKSTKARSLPGEVISTDNFFEDSKGNYNFDPEFLPVAHQCTQAKVELLMKKGKDIVLDNTNIKCWQFERYLCMAKHFGYDYEVVLPDTPWAWDVEECFKRNSHRLPKETIERMKADFEWKCPALVCSGP